MLFRQRKLGTSTPVVSVGILLCLAFSIFSYVSSTIPFAVKLSDLKFELRYLYEDGTSVVEVPRKDLSISAGVKLVEIYFDLSNIPSVEVSGLYITSIHNALKVFADDKQITEMGVFVDGLPPQKHDVLVKLPSNTKSLKIVSSLANLSEKHLDFIFNSGLGPYDGFKRSEFAKQIFVNYGYFGLFFVFLLIAFGVFLFRLNHTSEVSLFLIVASGTQALVSLYFSRLLQEEQYFLYFSQICFSIYFISIAATLKLFSILLGYSKDKKLNYLNWLLFFCGPVTGIVFLYSESRVAFIFYKFELFVCASILLVSGFAVSRSRLQVSQVGPLRLAYYVFGVGQINDILRVFQFKIFLYNIGPYFYFISMMFIIIAWAQQLFEQHTKAQNSEKQIVMARVARQLSHDIRSPMSALSMVMNDLDDISQEKKLLLQQIYRRINHLANELLLQAKKADSQIPSVATLVSDTRHVVLLNEVINEISTEKSNESIFRKNIKVLLQDESTSPSFVRLSPQELKRVISNLINNSVDASCAGQEVVLRLVAQGGHAYISIQDFGQGMSPEILDRLGKEEFSFGKEGIAQSGSGIGVKYCSDVISSWGGQLRFQSAEGVGTTVHLTLPTVPSPEWFCYELKVYRNSKIVLVDDDESVLEMWKQRFMDLGITPVLGKRLMTPF